MHPFYVFFKQFITWRWPIAVDTCCNNKYYKYFSSAVSTLWWRW